LIFAGGLNGLILPVALALILIAAFKKDIMHQYKHPYWMQAAGWLVVVAMSYLGAKGIINLF
jgi:Mn2+/Fe2+ NRAMP family transporter